MQSRTPRREHPNAALSVSIQEYFLIILYHAVHKPLGVLPILFDPSNVDFHLLVGFYLKLVYIPLLVVLVTIKFLELHWEVSHSVLDLIKFSLVGHSIGTLHAL